MEISKQQKYISSKILVEAFKHIYNVHSQVVAEVSDCLN